MKKTTAFLFLLLSFSASARACDSHTNITQVIYCIDCGMMSVGGQAQCPEVAWSQVAGYKSNWGYATGDGAPSCQTTVTYSVAFSDVPDVVINCLGSTNAVPASRDDVRVAANYVCTAQAPLSNQFTVVIIDVSGGNISTNTRVAFSWIAKPAGSD